MPPICGLDPDGCWSLFYSSPANYCHPRSLLFLEAELRIELASIMQRSLSSEHVHWEDKGAPLAGADGRLAGHVLSACTGGYRTEPGSSLEGSALHLP